MKCEERNGGGKRKRVTRDQKKSDIAELRAPIRYLSAQCCLACPKIERNDRVTTPEFFISCFSFPREGPVINRLANDFHVVELQNE